MSSFSRILLPFIQTNGFDKLVIDYLNDDVFLKKFYAFDDDFEGIRERIRTYANPRLNRDLLKEVLLNQYKSYELAGPKEKVLKNINSIVNPTTFTVTTGHQLNIFSGPLYVIYKLISTIKLAEKLKAQFPENDFVPIYWMASEDHDIKEIASVNLFGKKYEWNSEWTGPAGKMPLKGIETIINEMKIVLGESSTSTEIFSLISSAYVESKTLAEATRKWIHNLLGKYGLVIIDGNDSSLKQSIKDILSDEIINQSSSEIILNTTKELDKKYYSQAKPREINMFYLGENYRERIVKENDNFKVLNTDLVFTKDKIAEELKNFPEKFSPNVLLRPLYQESILPNIVFVGGPAEISYWLELKELFEFHKVPMPVLLMRCSALLLDKSIQNKLEKLSIKKTDIFLPVDDLLKTFIHNKEKNQPPFESEMNNISDSFSKLGNLISQIEPTLKAAVEAENVKLSTSLRNLEDKTIRALKKKNETEVNQIRKIKEKLFPSGKMQERDESFIQWYFQWGDGFIEALLENFDPLEKKFIVLEESPG